jgi:hypothetical protein
MRTPEVPVMHCKKVGVTDMFRQRSVIELVKEGNPIGVIYERLSETKPQSVEWYHITSPKKAAENSTLGWESYENCLLG